MEIKFTLSVVPCPWQPFWFILGVFMNDTLVKTLTQERTAEECEKAKHQYKLIINEQ